MPPSKPKLKVPIDSALIFIALLLALPYMLFSLYVWEYAATSPLWFLYLWAMMGLLVLFGCVPPLRKYLNVRRPKALLSYALFLGIPLLFTSFCHWGAIQDFRVRMCRDPLHGIDLHNVEILDADLYFCHFKISKDVVGKILSKWEPAKEVSANPEIARIDQWVQTNIGSDWSRSVYVKGLPDIKEPSSEKATYNLYLLYNEAAGEWLYTRMSGDMLESKKTSQP